MKKIFLAGTALVFFVACNNSGKDKTTTDTTTTSETNRMDTTTKGPVDDATRTFMTTIANSGMAEVQVASIAKDKAQNAAVKDFAAMLFRDHSAVNDQVKSMASQRNIALPDSISADKKKMIDDLNKKSGKDFDKEFLSAMIKGHEAGISLFENAATSDPDADVRNFAGQTLPKLREHRDSAMALQKKYFK